MFPEYRDLISRLKTEHPRFRSLFEKHNALDHEIAILCGEDGQRQSPEATRLKKEKLLTKDAMHQILIEESSKSR